MADLTLYQIIRTFNDPVKEAFWKKNGKRRKCWLPAFSPFSLFSSQSNKDIVIPATFKLFSANAFKWTSQKFLSFGKELTELFLGKLENVGKMRNCRRPQLSPFLTGTTMAFSLFGKV